MPTIIRTNFPKKGLLAFLSVSQVSTNSQQRVVNIPIKRFYTQAIIIVAMGYLMTIATFSYSQSLVQLVSATNPLLGIQTSSLNSSLRFVDIDSDGDMDAFIGSASGQVEFFRNDGTKTIPAFTVVTGTDNPFDGIFSPAGHSTLGFVDIDNDGDMDAFLGDDVVISIFNMSGQLLKSTTTNENITKVDFSDLDAGIYMVTITNSMGQSVQKIVKQ